MDLDRGAGAFATGLGVLGDLFATGGDTVVAVAAFVVETIDLWLPFLSRLATVARSFEWLPVDLIEFALTTATVVFVVVYGVEILQRWVNNE